MPVLLFACVSALLLRPAKDLNLNTLGTHSIPCEWGKEYSGQTGQSFTPDSKNTNAITNRTNWRRWPRVSTQH